MPQASEVTRTTEEYGEVLERRVAHFVFVVPFEAAIFALRPGHVHAQRERGATSRP